jgi:DNA polymerase-3 subunit gamma/tau
MSQVLYRKYRPRNWNQVIGQQQVVLTLQHAIAADRVGHAYLFAGPRGTGKTTLARILAKAVNCLADQTAERPCNKCDHCTAVNENRFLDLIEMDAASNTGVEDVRDLRDKIGFAPSQGRYKVYIIDEAHMLSTPAFNALLKTLEEPPPHAIFVLATTEIHKIPATVLSRCQRHEFRRVAVDDIVGNLKSIVQQEGWQAEDEALGLIARQATGSIRDAQSLLDQLSSAGQTITLDLAQAALGIATSRAVFEMLDAIQAQSGAESLETVHRAMDAGTDPRTLARQVVEYLRGLMLIQMGNPQAVDAGKDVRARMEAHAGAFSHGDVLRMMRVFNAAALDTRGGWQPSLSLELAVAEALEPAARTTAAGAPAAVRGAPDRGKSGPDPAARAEAPKRTTDRDHRQSRPVLAQAGLHREDQSGRLAERSAATESGQVNAATADLSLVMKSWKEIRAALKPRHPGVEALLNSCKPVEVAGGALVLGFQSETVLALMDKPENLEAAAQAIAEVLGSSMQIRCVVTNARGKVPSQLSHDGMVATALDHGGEIVDVQD